MDSSERKKVAVACQGGGAHAAFEVGVLTEILKDYKKDRFDLVGLSGTSSGALCTLMVWYGLAPQRSGGHSGSADDAIRMLNQFWENFVACTDVEVMLNSLTYGAFKAEETEIPLLGINAPIWSLNPRGAIYKAFAACLPSAGVRKRYFDLDYLLADACPQFDNIDWPKVKTRLLIGASEVVNGLETVFDSNVNKGTSNRDVYYWRQRLQLSLAGVAAAGTFPTFREAERIDNSYYWDGLYSQNPPVRELLWEDAKVAPDELWVVRINPQQCVKEPKSNATIQHRQNELMGNLSLNKELDFIMKVNHWIARYKGDPFANDHKHVTVRTIMMTEKTAEQLRYSSKFNRSREFMIQLCAEGREVARNWLDKWPSVSEYPEDAAYYAIPTTTTTAAQAFAGF